MKLGAGVVFVALGLLVLWLSVTGRLSNLSAAWGVLTGDTAAPGASPTAAPGMPGTAPASAAALGLPWPLPVSVPAVRV